MSLQSVDRELRNFLTAADASVVALKGQWGSGKTYYWRNFLERYGSSGRTCSYVSLFGVGSLDELKDALFTNAAPTIPPPSGRAESAGSTVVARGTEQIRRLRDRAGQLARKHSTLLERLPKVNDFGPFARAAAFLTISDYVVCVDDLERRGESLPLRDVLGLLTMLREERRCRVLVVLNLDALSAEDKTVFESHREKVFDYEILFAPTPKDCAAIVFPQDSSLYERAAKYSERLQISNIRVLHRIRRLIDAVTEFASQSDDRVHEHLVRSAVLLGWCFNTRTGDAPDYEYVKSWSYARVLLSDSADQQTAEEKRWNKVLSSYGYHNTGELDVALCDVLERGYVEATNLGAVLADRAEAARRELLEEAFHDAWRVYHEGFDPDATALVAGFESSMRRGAEVISLGNASAATRILRELGCDDLADDLMFHWIHTHQRINPRVLDVEHHSWSHEIRDDRFRAEAQAAFTRAANNPRTLPEVAVALARRDGWSSEDIRVLSSASEDEYYQLFKSLEGENTRSVVKACLQFGQDRDSSASFRVIDDLARAALVRIAQESKLNKLRVESYGINVDGV